MGKLVLLIIRLRLTMAEVGCVYGVCAKIITPKVWRFWKEERHGSFDR